MSLSLNSMSASARSAFDSLKTRLSTTMPLSTASTAGTLATEDRYDRGSIADPIGFVSSAFATKQTVTAVSAVINAKDAATTMAGQASRFSKGFAAVRNGAAANIGIGTAIGAGLSFVGNAVDLIRGKATPGQAVGRMAADSVGAAVSATGSVLIGGAATAALGALGVVGLPLTIAGIGVSMLAGWAADSVYRRSHVAEGIYGSVKNALGG
jgi:hypothetical protein